MIWLVTGDTVSRKILLGFGLILSGISSLAAAPRVVSTAGVPQQGQEWALNGSGFGSRGDYHADADKLIRVFDDFNDGSLLANPYMEWGVFGAGAVVLNPEGPRTSQSGDQFARRTNRGLGWIGLKGTDQREYYMSFYMRLSDGFDVNSDPSGTHQFKIVRLYSNNSPANLYPTIGGPDGFFMSVEFLNPEVMRYQTQFNDIPDHPKGWHKMAIYYKKSTSPGANDGKCQIWWDNKMVFDWAAHFKNPANNPSYAPGYPITGDFDVDDADLAGDWALGDYFSSAGPHTWVDFDDVYVDHTLARVELGDAPTYAACTRLETQTPLSWSDSQIKVRTNLGAFSPAAPKFIYVTDKNGVTNAEGFPLSAPGVNAPPAPPLMLRLRGL